MPFLALTAVLAGWCSHHYWMRVAGAEKDWAKRFWPWLLQGLLFPSLLFCIFNVGFGSRVPPLVPQILEAQRHNHPWFWLWVMWSLAGALLIIFYWAAITYCWLLARIVHLADDRKEVLLNILLFGFFSGSVAGVLVYFSGWIYLGPGICFALLPIVHFTVDLAEKPPAVATYARAIAQRKRGKIQDAEWEVISQLEKSENDFEGWMLLAEMYAKDYRNMEDAARVILDICRQPDLQQVHISVACHKLADWQLEFADNPIGARAALELLCRKLPGTHFAHMAQQRIRQIPSTFEEFDELKKPRRIRLPTLAEGSTPARVPPPSSRADAAAEANRLSAKLTDDPNDIPSREKLALVLSEKLGKIDLAIEQLTLLADLPDPTEEQKSKWLAQIASWEFTRDQDAEKFKDALRRVINDYPQTSHAFAAQRRLYLLEMNYSDSPASASPAAMRGS